MLQREFLPTYLLYLLYRYVLCYKWRNSNQEGFVPFTSVTATVLQFSGLALPQSNDNMIYLGGVSPLYNLTVDGAPSEVQYIPTSLGCVANVRIFGQGFQVLGGGEQIMCHYDVRAGGDYDYDYDYDSGDPANSNSVPSSLATYADGHLVCAIPELPYLGDFGFRVSFGLRNVSFNDIRTYDARATLISTLSPAGSGYNRPFSIELRGSGLAGFGDQKCVLGPSVTPPWTTKTYDSVYAKVYNSSYAVCDFDPIPDGDRDQLGELNLEWYSNGQCPSTTDATFHVWNAVLLGATPLGSPLPTVYEGGTGTLTRTPLDVYVAGSGFNVPTSYDHATCRFSHANTSRQFLALTSQPQRELQSTTSYTRPAQVLSEELVRCSMPNISHVGEWSLELLLNGQTAEPVLYDGAADAPLFTIYNLSEVHVTEIVPPGGPVCNLADTAQAGCQPIGVVLHGTGFADYGGTGALPVLIHPPPPNHHLFSHTSLPHPQQVCSCASSTVLPSRQLFSTASACCVRCPRCQALERSR